MFTEERLGVALAEVNELATELADLAECNMTNAGGVDPLARTFRRVTGRGARVLTAVYAVLKEEIAALVTELERERQGNGDTLSKPAAKPAEQVRAQAPGPEPLEMPKNRPEPAGSETPEVPQGRKSTIRVLQPEGQPQFRDTTEDLVWIFGQRHPRSRLSEEALKQAIQADLDLGIRPGEVWHELEHTAAEADYGEISQKLRARILGDLREKQERARAAKQKWHAKHRKRPEAVPVRDV